MNATLPGSAREAMWVAVSGLAWIVGLLIVELAAGQGVAPAGLVPGVVFVVAAVLVFGWTPWANVSRAVAWWGIAVALVGVLLWPVVLSGQAPAEVGSWSSGPWLLLLGASLLYGTIVTVALLGPVLLLTHLFPARPTN